ncbi:MAG: amino acid adenylation domain-containing protein [Actinophytocola sp.]|uniref:non-ribosomal peptide synthetase n=1 Tax=Actinophytocola sp. TaxID=1872138 RepID=UPI00132BC3AB|nr:non-ribosomal peptide synthetase [Actinophytocola sp.]MPZ81292.1 amino acid adenylation domain-containing protein [Actinophytocola sp.]
MVSRCIQRHFAAQVALTPDAPAVVCGEVRLSYRELDERANHLAHRLRERGAGPEVPVAVLMERSADLVVATLAVLKTGSYYLPLHTAYPPERLQWLVDQAGAPVLVTDEATHERGTPRGCQVVVADADPDATTPPVSDPAIENHPEHIAYLMYTSGSTGEPKGVAVTHRDALGLALDQCWDSGAHERVLMVAPYAFGMSTYELWVPLLRGGVIIMPPAGEIEVGTIRRLIVEEDVTVVHLTAGLFRVFAEEAPEALAPLREVMTGGDVISPTAVARVLEACPGISLRAMYGQTETTLFTTTWQIAAPYEPDTTVPIGRAMDNMRVYILDKRLRPVAAGLEGELYVAGTGVARGYLGRPDLTAERFVPDPFTGSGERMYRTGDLARWTPAGLVDFIGRADGQVKIRGFRVELAEVEAVLARYPGVAHVAVVAHDLEPGDKRLAAHVVPESDRFDAVALRDYAADLLPDYMVPAAIAVLDSLPLTANGKLDRRALPMPMFGNAADYEAPRTPTEEALCAMFADVFGVSQVGVDDSFYDLSGQSMQVIRLIARVEQELGPRLEVIEVYDYPTPAQLAERVDRAADNRAA